MLEIIIASAISSLTTMYIQYRRDLKKPTVQGLKCSRLIQESGRVHPCEGIRLVQNNQLFDWESEATS